MQSNFAGVCAAHSDSRRTRPGITILNGRTERRQTKGRAGELRNRVGRGCIDEGVDEPSPSADMGGASLGPVPLLRGRAKFSRGADVGRAGPNSGADEGRSEEGDTSG